MLDIKKFIEIQRIKTNIKDKQIAELQKYYDGLLDSDKETKNWVLSNFPNIYNNPDVNIVKKEIDNLKDKFQNKKSQIKKDEGEDEFFYDNFEVFFNWWIADKHGNNAIGYKNVRENMSKCCFYCGVTENKLDWIFKNNSIYDTSDKDAYRKGTYHKSKKGDSWNNPFLEIERLDPNGGYTPENCVFACHLCNNAKTDIIEATDFIDNIANGFANYYNTLKQNYE